jgi:hypothetical protein
MKEERALSLKDFLRKSTISSLKKDQSLICPSP